MHQQPVLTPNQTLVWETLVQARTPLGAYALLERLQGGKLKAPLQIYRALDKLVEFGMVHRLESLNAFVVCAHRHDESGQTAFAICDTCGLVEEFADPAIGQRLTLWSRDSAFKPSNVTVEIRGLCAACNGGTN